MSNCYTVNSISTCLTADPVITCFYLPPGMLLALLNYLTASLNDLGNKISTRTEEFLLLYVLTDEVVPGWGCFSSAVWWKDKPDFNDVIFNNKWQVLQGMFTNSHKWYFTGVSYSPLKPKCHSLARQCFHSGLNYIEVLWLLILK